MATLKKTRSAQYALSATFEFNIATADNMLDIAGVSKAFSVTAPVYDIIPLPYGSVVTGGDMIVKTISNDTGTATAAIGDSASAARYMAATDIKTAARTAFVPTGYAGLGEALRLTLANQNGNATAGRVKFRVDFYVDNRQNENLKTT
jgi:hypothetical protein